MYEHDVKPEIEQALSLLHSIDYHLHNPIQIAGITGRAQGVLQAMLICNADKELIWQTAKKNVK